MTRIFDASREGVWKEWIDPERFADWFGGSESEVPLSSISRNVTPGGSWRATMSAGPDRREIQWKGEYREVVEPERLTFTLSDRPDDRYELVTVVLIDLGDGRAEMHFEQRGHMAPQDYDRAKKGWTGFVDRIGEHLAAA